MLIVTVKYRDGSSNLMGKNEKYLTIIRIKHNCRII